ncbi:MAG: hypothetical protein Q8O56_07435 [Solirubrobacteraceae bacterium]|nr:hypothetical protein [Solirubrobacteraceae bacterium]
MSPAPRAYLDLLAVVDERGLRAGIEAQAAPRSLPDGSVYRPMTTLVVTRVGERSKQSVSERIDGDLEGAAARLLRRLPPHREQVAS